MKRIIPLILIQCLYLTTFAQALSSPNVEMWGKALDYYSKAIKGDAEAQYELACCYFDGEYTVKDYKKALQWAQKSSDKGFPAGSYFIALCYQDGDGVKKNEKTAKLWYIKAHQQAQPLAEKGDAVAQYVMGKLYYYGASVSLSILGM